jgi:formylglycine-generating enzyme required for sulfatase activity
VMRGGSWAGDIPNVWGTSFRNGLQPGDFDSITGFRCARDANP